MNKKVIEALKKRKQDYIKAINEHETQILRLDGAIFLIDELIKEDK